MLCSLAALAALLLAGDDPAPVVGWRGDGSGRYPAATPPTTWGRVSAALQGLKSQADKPKAPDVGAPMADGVIREWLVLGPAPAGVKVDKEVLPGEAELSPSEGDKLGEASWKKVRFDTAWMNFHSILETPDRSIACAFTYLYSDTGGPFRVNATTPGGFRIVLNGKALPAGYGRYSLDLAKGWNRLLLKVAAHESNWACSFVLHAKAPATYEQTNLAWSVPLPGVQGGFYGGGMGCGSPVIVDDRIYLLSEPHDLICLRKADGKILWVRTSSFFDAATEEDRKKPAYAEAEAISRKLNELNAALPAAPLEEKTKLENGLSAKMQEVDPVRYKKYETPDVGFSGFTPVCDGQRLYVWLGNGVTACYDLDGKRLWIRADPLPAVEHGFSSSPLLVDGKVVVFMRDLFAFDAATGRQAWRIPVVAHEGANPGGYFHGTPIRVVRGGVPLIVLGNGSVVRAADGQVLFSHKEMGNQAISSPVVDGDRLLETSTGSMKLFLHALPAAVSGPFRMETQTVSVATTGHPFYYMPWHMASPLVHDGLAYLLNNSGVLTVVDLQEARVLYQRMIDLDQFQTSNEGAARGVGISPTLAGKFIYLFGNNGGAVVIEPGRTFKQVAKNKIESLASVGHWGERQERFVSNPVFDGDRLYIRGEGHLYAVAAGAPITRSTTSREPPPRPAPRPAPAPVVATGVDPELNPAPVFGWRRNGSGIFPGTEPPTEWGDKKNIKWQARVGGGDSSPVLAGDRVIVLAEPGILTALDRRDGRVAWTVDLGFRRRANVPADAKEFARATPVVDAASVYVASSNGIVAAYSLEGKLRWTRDVEPPRLTYGASSSPLLAGDKLLVDGLRLSALDPATGRVLWKAVEGESHYGTPALVSVDGRLLAVTSMGTVIQVSDGVVLAKEIAPGLGGDQAPSPVVLGGVVYFAYRRCSAVKLRFVDGRLRADKVWERELPGDVIASPVLKDGMLFVVPGGAPDYRVLNAATGEILLEKELDFSGGLQPSLALAGKHLYLGNDQGEVLVLDPSREYKELRRNSLTEGSSASPVFGGSSLFLRGGEWLYCIGP